MPVLKIMYSRIEKMTGSSRERILDRLPYLGLDIESVDADSVRVEYNPNRPDFSTDYGVARALLGLMGKKTGLPLYRVRPAGGSGAEGPRHSREGPSREMSRRGRTSSSSHQREISSQWVVDVDENLATVRPYIACAVARQIELDDETIRQLISMQEDLHNGIARKRRKAAIGLHDLDAIRPPLTYRGEASSFQFIPLGSTRSMSLTEILERTETGVEYGHLMKDAGAYPILSDSEGTVLSFPPIINGDKTRVGTRTRNLFIDVTSTDERIGDEVLAIICAAVADAGASLESVRVDYPRGSSRSRKNKEGSQRRKNNKEKVKKKTMFTPSMEPTKMKFDHALSNQVTGLSLSISEARRCLRRSRLDLDDHGIALIPSYRVDILHPVDLAEEVAIGYGLDRIEPLYPESRAPGSYDLKVKELEKVADFMARAGFLEAMNYDLVDEPSLYAFFSRSSERRLEVEDPRSQEHAVLRDALVPSLLSVLSRNAKSAYPQRIFEVGRVFSRVGDDSGGLSIGETPHLAALVAHSSASFTEAKTYLEALVRERTGDTSGLSTVAGQHWAFAEGRCAAISLEGGEIGHVGEVRPSALVAFGLDVPVSGFEIDLSGWS